MNGYRLTFYTQQDRMHGQVPLAQWLFAEAKRRGFGGATVTGSLEGLGHDGNTHATNWFDLSDQPVHVTMITTAGECERLLEDMKHEKVQVFYVKIPVEFGYLDVEDRLSDD